MLVRTALIAIIQLWLMECALGAVPQISSLNVQCDRTGMRVKVNFDSEFNGIVFSKGHYADLGCRYVQPNAALTTADIEIPVDKCGTNTLDIDGEDGTPPKRGFENILVFQNDPTYQEVFDHARMVVCRYTLEDDFDLKEKRVVFRPVVIDMLDVVSIPVRDSDGLQSRVDCWMEITKGRFPQTSPIDSAVKVGNPLTLAIFVKDPRKRTDLRVKDCYAYDDPQVAETNGPALLQLTDFDGCPTKPKLIEVWRRTHNTGPTGATVIAFTTVTAFKFPDRPDLQLTCNIELCRNSCAQRCSAELPGPVDMGTWTTPIEEGTSGGGATTEAPSQSTEGTEEGGDEDKEEATTAASGGDEGDDGEEESPASTAAPAEGGDEGGESEEESPASTAAPAEGGDEGGDSEEESPSSTAAPAEGGDEGGDSEEESPAATEAPAEGGDSEEESPAATEAPATDSESDSDSESESESGGDSEEVTTAASSGGEEESESESESESEATTAASESDSSDSENEADAEESDSSDSSEETKESEPEAKENDSESSDSEDETSNEEDSDEDTAESRAKIKAKPKAAKSQAKTTTTTTTTTTAPPTTAKKAKTTKSTKAAKNKAKTKATTPKPKSPKSAAQIRPSDGINSIVEQVHWSRSTLRPLRELMDFTPKSQSTQKSKKSSKNVSSKPKSTTTTTIKTTTTTTTTTTTPLPLPSTTTKSAKKSKKPKKSSTTKTTEKPSNQVRRARAPSLSHPDEFPHLHIEEMKRSLPTRRPNPMLKLHSISETKSTTSNPLNISSIVITEVISFNSSTVPTLRPQIQRYRYNIENERTPSLVSQRSKKESGVNPRRQSPRNDDIYENPELDAFTQFRHFQPMRIRQPNHRVVRSIDLSNIDPNSKVILHTRIHSAIQVI